MMIKLPLLLLKPREIIIKNGKLQQVLLLLEDLQ